MTSDKVHLWHCLLYKFDKGSTTDVECHSIHHIYGGGCNWWGFGNSWKDTEAIKIRQGEDAVHSLD